MLKRRGLYMFQMVNSSNWTNLFLFTFYFIVLLDSNIECELYLFISWSFFYSLRLVCRKCKKNEKTFWYIDCRMCVQPNDWYIYVHKILISYSYRFSFKFSTSTLYCLPYKNEHIFSAGKSHFEYITYYIAVKHTEYLTTWLYQSTRTLSSFFWRLCSCFLLYFCLFIVQNTG